MGKPVFNSSGSSDVEYNVRDKINGEQKKE